MSDLRFRRLSGWTRNLEESKQPCMDLAIDRARCYEISMLGRVLQGALWAWLTLVLGGVGGCTRQAPAAPELLLAGRSRTVAFLCPPEQPRRPSRDPVKRPMTCAKSGRGGFTWANVDPPRPVPLGMPSPSQGGSEFTPCVPGISICWVEIRAPEGSHALACRDPEGQSHGPVEVVAPDGSLIAHGLCVHGMPSGTWFWWQHEKLALTRTFESRSTDDLRYVAPDRYSYGQFLLVPIDPTEPSAAVAPPAGSRPQSTAGPSAAPTAGPSTLVPTRTGPP